MRNVPLSVVAAVGLLLAPGAALAAPANNHPFAASFARADRNKDGFLDEAELAKEFRGPNAKPITDAPGKRETHPDHAFLAVWDANKDGKISRAEFEKYEQKAVASAKAASNRLKNYTRGNRAKHRQPMRHRGFSRRGGSNPFANLVRYQQRMFQLQRQAFANRLRYGAYTPHARGGFRGVMHHHARRR